MPYSFRLTICLLAALGGGACSLDLSGTLSGGDGGVNMDDDGITPGGGSGGPTTGSVGNGGASGGTSTSGGGGNSTGVSPMPDASVENDGSTAPQDSGNPQDPFVGDYAEKRAFRTQQKMQSGAISTTVRILTTTYAVVRIANENGEYRFYERACRMSSETESEGMLQIEISIEDAVPRSLPETSSEFTVADANGKQTFSRPITTSALGWKPDSLGDKLPATQNDARLRDADGDGKPAVSATISNGGVIGRYEAYFVQWNSARYEGEVASDGRLEGDNFDTTLQNVVGTSMVLPGTGRNTQPTPDPDTSDNRITLVPLPDALDCDELVAQIDTIF